MTSCTAPTRRRIFAALLLITTVAVSGCGDSHTAPPEPAVDIAKLDSGNYPTTPQDVEKAKTPESSAVQESIRMADVVPLMMDIDSRMIYSPGLSEAGTAAYPPPILDKDTTFSDVAPGLVAGWFTRGRRRSDMELGLAADMTVLRFGTAEQAANAARAIAGNERGQYPGKATATIPEYPAAQADLSQYDALRTWLVSDTYVVSTYVSDALTTPPDPAPLIDFTKKVLDRLIDGLKTFRPTPADQLTTLAADKDGLLGRTLPADKPSATTGVYSPHAALHRQMRPDLSKRAFDDAKVDLVSSNADTVYRTADSAAAHRLRAAFLDELSVDYQPIDGPPGLPTAKCLKNRDPDESELRCYLTYDRYVAEVMDTQPQILYQQTAAQYKLLAAGR